MFRFAVVLGILTGCLRVSQLVLLVSHEDLPKAVSTKLLRTWLALAKATYSASAVERATQVCFLLRQLIVAPLIMKRYADVDFRSLTSPAQSASEYPHIVSSFLEYKRP